MTSNRSLVALALLAMVWLAMLLTGGSESVFDPAILGLLYAGDRPGPAMVAIWITQLGGWIGLGIVTVAAAAFLLVRRRYRDTALLLFITLSGRLVVELQKSWSARARPQDEHLVTVHSLSFPSGHSANSMIVYLTIALLLLPGRAPVVAALGLSMIIGLTRLLLGVHWPSDVVGGWAFGLAWTFGLVRLTGISEERRVVGLDSGRD
ncbi:MAG: phosphatase PAP2 family protein [Sphingosinicella sp.]|nr:phosphatase PAP2 family protein [Sphingosinicella sp.]